MKPLIRISAIIASLVLLLWGGVAVPAETPTVPESSEYLMGTVKAYPAWGIGDVVACDQMDAATARAAGCPEVVALPAPGTYEYSVAMETGSLPSTCGDKPCPAERFTIIEIGGMPYRLEVDFGGN